MHSTQEYSDNLVSRIRPGAHSKTEQRPRTWGQSTGKTATLEFNQFVY